MNLIVRVLFLSIPAVLAVVAYPNDAPDKSCNCLPLQNCYSVLSKLKSSYRRDYITHKAYTKYLDIINCGYFRTEPYVCCPREIPSEVVKLVENKKYWTKSQEQASLKKLKYATAKAKESNSLAEEPTAKLGDSEESPVTPDVQTAPEQLMTPYQFPGCGVYYWREDFLGNATYIGEYPWLALLEFDTPEHGKQPLCGGVLISDQHILTAARCVTSRSNNLTSVILGEYDTNANPECMPDGANNPPFCVNSMRKYEVEYSVTHGGYNDGVSHRDSPNSGVFQLDFLEDGFEPPLHDIAIVKLKTKVQFTYYIRPICLPTRKPETRLFKVAGWGRSFVPENQGLNLKLMSYLRKCDRSDYARREVEQMFDEKEHICARKRKNGYSNPCIVDSGGPLMANERKDDGAGRMTVYGISFMESTCGDFGGKPSDLPGIFTDVYNYRDWIIKYMNV